MFYGRTVLMPFGVGTRRANRLVEVLNEDKAKAQF